MSIPRSFKDFVHLKQEGIDPTADGDAGGPKKDWRKEYIQLERGFIPPSKLRPVIEAFLNSGNIKIMDDG